MRPAGMFDPRPLLPVIERMRELGARRIPANLELVCAGVAQTKYKQIVAMIDADAAGLSRERAEEFKGLVVEAGREVKRQVVTATTERN